MYIILKEVYRERYNVAIAKKANLFYLQSTLRQIQHSKLSKFCFSMQC